MGGVILDDLQIELAVLQIDLGYLDGQLVSQPKTVSRLVANDHLTTSFKSILIVGKRRDWDEPVNWQFQATCMDAILEDAADDRLHGLTKMLFQEMQKFQFD